MTTDKISELPKNCKDITGMSIPGIYYLHKNGDLVFMQNLPGTAADLRESDFAVMFWPADTADRECMWQILVEALACGASLARVQELAAKWYCDDDDAQVYAQRTDVGLFLDGDQWCATREDFVDLQKSPAGFGDTALEAMAELCQALGYKPQKMWGASFADLLKRGNMNKERDMEKSIKEFAARMQMKLDKNKYKESAEMNPDGQGRHWKHCRLNWLLYRLRQETLELEEAIMQRGWIKNEIVGFILRSGWGSHGSTLDDNQKYG